MRFADNIYVYYADDFIEEGRGMKEDLFGVCKAITNELSLSDLGGVDEEATQHSFR